MKETIDKIRAACKVNRTPLLYMLLFIAAFAIVNGREIAQEVSATYSAGGTGDAGNGTFAGETQAEVESDAADSQPGTDDGTAGDEGADGKSGNGDAASTSDGSSGTDASGDEDQAAGEDGESALTQEELLRHERRLLSQMGSSFRIPMNMPARLRSGYVLAMAAGSRGGTTLTETLPGGGEDGQGEEVPGDTHEDAGMPGLVRSDGAVLYEYEASAVTPYLELYDWHCLRGYEVLSSEQAAWYGITVETPDGLAEHNGRYDIYEIRDLSVLRTMLETKLSEYDGVWSVYVKNLTSGDSFVINDSPMKSASVMKLFVMGTVYKAFESGELERTDEVMSLVSNMIINSDNEATNQLLYRLGDSDYESGIRKVDEFIAEGGFSDMTVEYNGFENPDTVTVSGSYNQVAAKDCGKLLEDIYRRTWMSRAVSNEMEQLLLSQGTRYKIPAGLPDGVLCGNKTGEMNTTENDAAIIYGEDCDYILVVLSSDWASKDQAISRIQEISRTVYEFLN